MTKAPESHNWSFTSRRRLFAGLVLLLTALALLAWLQPTFLLDAADLVGYGVCHQIAARSFHLHDRATPLCARCTGTFSGALLGFIVLFVRRRERCRDLPARPVLIVLASFLLFWGIDGLNSYLTLFPGAPHLYEPHNLLRLSAGLLNGLALSHLIYPVFSLTLWAETIPGRSLQNLTELALPVGLAGAVVLAIWSNWTALIYLASLFSTLGVLCLLLVVNGIIAVIALRRESRARTWKDTIFPMGVALAASLAEIALLNGVRGYLTHTFGLPF